MSNKEKMDKEKDLFWSKKEPKKTFQTFLRNQNKLYINSFNMIDRKAAIMIRINSIIISAIIVFYDYVRDLHMGQIIGVVMVISCFISLMLAINASRPHTFKIFRSFRQKWNTEYQGLESKVFSVGTLEQVSLDDYQKAYDKVLQNQELQVGNQVRTIYLFEKYIKDAFMHLELAYLAFMIGFSLMVLLFIIGIFVDFI